MRSFFFNDKTLRKMNEAKSWTGVYLIMMRSIRSLCPKGVIDDILIANLMFEKGFYMKQFLKGENLGNKCGYIVLDWSNRKEVYQWMYKMFHRFHLFFSDVPLQDQYFEEAFEVFCASSGD